MLITNIIEKLYYACSVKYLSDDYDRIFFDIKLQKLLNKEGEMSFMQHLLLFMGFIFVNNMLFKI